VKKIAFLRFAACLAVAAVLITQRPVVVHWECTVTHPNSGARKLCEREMNASVKLLIPWGRTVVPVRQDPASRAPAVPGDAVVG
jgi:hypothetical protein